MTVAGRVTLEEALQEFLIAREPHVTFMSLRNV